MRFAAGTRSPSKNTSVVEWLIIVSMGRIVTDFPTSFRRSTRKTDIPAVGFALSSRGVVRASRSMRSECSEREIQVFCPWITYASPSRSAVVAIRVVSVPQVGSLTPNACRRNSPAAIRGRYRRFCASLPCLSSVPMMYIWA